MKRAQAVRRSPSEIALVHQLRAYRLATTPAERRRESVASLACVLGIAALVFSVLSAGVGYP
jgi:hypothetical protein